MYTENLSYVNQFKQEQENIPLSTSEDQTK